MLLRKTICTEMESLDYGIFLYIKDRTWYGGHTETVKIPLTDRTEQGERLWN
jgi:hypothetical protein